MKVNLLKVIQARIEELLEYRYCEKDELTNAYLNVMLASRQADLPALRLALEEMQSLPLPGEWKDIARLRLECLENTIDKKHRDRGDRQSDEARHEMLQAVLKNRFFVPVILSQACSSPNIFSAKYLENFRIYRRAGPQRLIASTCLR